MFAYIVRRLLIMPITLFGVTLLIFGFLQTLGPNERAALYVRDIPKNERQLDAIIRKYGLDDPLPIQYSRWMLGTIDSDTGERVGGVIRGDLGFSRTGREPVVDLFKRKAPISLELTLYSLIPVLGVGIWLGIKAALNHNKLFDQVARVFSIIGYSFPTFVFGLLMILLFYALMTRWARTYPWLEPLVLPPGRISDEYLPLLRSDEWRAVTGMHTVDALISGRLDVFWDAFRHMILPVITLSYVSWAGILKITRGAMLEVIGQDYVTTAHSKGLSNKYVINKHVRPNAMIPIITIAGGTVAGLLNGVLVTEVIFNIPGLGAAAVAAAVSLDALTMLGFALFNGVLFVFTYLIVDILYAMADPRIRLG
ncbi:MAG: peptide/nickel transport system permease protein [Cellvibrionaceae bacterium]|jgi:peptide/nickel transport system permease protein